MNSIQGTVFSFAALVIGIVSVAACSAPTEPNDENRSSVDDEGVKENLAPMPDFTVKRCGGVGVARNFPVDAQFLKQFNHSIQQIFPEGSPSNPFLGPMTLNCAGVLVGNNVNTGAGGWAKCIANPKQNDIQNGKLYHDDAADSCCAVIRKPDSSTATICPGDQPPVY